MRRVSRPQAMRVLRRHARVLHHCGIAEAASPRPVIAEEAANVAGRSPRGRSCLVQPNVQQAPPPHRRECADCSVPLDETLQISSDSVAAAPRACAGDRDCSLHGRRPNCVYGCGLFAAVADGAPLDAAIDRVDAELCPTRCTSIPSSCGGGPTPFDQPRAAARTTSVRSIPIRR